MATYTSHYNLTKPEGTERVNIGIINQNMDSIDAQMYKNAQSIIANHGGMAIPSNNNTHAAVSSGQYVYVYNHSSLAEGMYVAKSAISTNGALSLSNLTAVSNGGLNHVYSTLNSNIRNSVPTTLYRPFSGADKTSSFTYTVEHTGMLYLLFIGTVRTYCGITYNGAVIGGVAMASSNDPMATTITLNVKKGDTIGVNNLTENCYVSQQSALIANGYEPIV